MTVIFDTPGLLDIRAITTFGLNAKPESETPIGYFGTGLKYALAVLAREAQLVEIYIGKRHFEVGWKADEFRGKKFQALCLVEHGEQHDMAQQADLPFTTELGKDWQLWMAYRELYSNTLDELGQAIHTSKEPGTFADPERTIIAVSGEAFDNIYHNRKHIFLENAQRSGHGIEVLHQPSEFVFYRGIRAGQLAFPSLFTYNFLDHMDLTEDRNFANMWRVGYEISTLIVNSSKREYVELALGAGQAFFEGHLNFESLGYEPSATFKAVVSERTAKARPVPSSAVALLKKFRPKPKAPSWLEQLRNCAAERDQAGCAKVISANWEKFQQMLHNYEPEEIQF